MASEQQRDARSEDEEASAAAATVNEPHGTADFHVVAIGASAGGLESLERLFSTLPVDTGMAVVVLQHLSPDF
jgi:two-component system CheB/CheR fusion protein